MLDLVLIKKDQDGSCEAFEFADIEDGALGELRELKRELADLLSEDDVAAVADELEPGSTTGLLVDENLSAAPFASAVRRSGGQLITERALLGPVGRTTATVATAAVAAHGVGRRHDRRDDRRF